MRTRTFTAWLAVLALAAPLNAHADDHDALSERHMAESLAELQSAELLAEMHPAADPEPTHDESSVTHLVPNAHPAGVGGSPAPSNSAATHTTQPVATSRPALPSTGANR